MLFVHAQPGARRTEVAGVHGEALKIRVAARAVEGQANDALAAFIAQRLGAPARMVRLVSGAKSRQKRFEIAGWTVAPETLLPDGRIAG
jgi:uncharacterized protein (TIGR00251 family)